MSSNSHIVVLLASYNGEAWLSQQIDSIAAQKTPGGTVSLLVSDDNSTDNSCKVVSSACLNNDLPYSLFAPKANISGHRGNFQYICTEAKALPKADYYAFSDQDDVWHPDKISTLTKLLEIHEGPALVHSDLRVVDSKLNVIAASFFQFQGLPDAENHGFSDLLLQNVVTGCATLFNRELLEIATPIPEQSVIHDHWFALVAAYFGTLKFSSAPLVDYRQHGENAIGATDKTKQRSYLSSHFYKTLMRFPLHFSQAVEQAKALEKRRIELDFDVSEEKQKSVLLFAGLKEVPLLKRLKMQSVLFKRKRSWKERIYISLVLAILPRIKCRYTNFTRVDGNR